MRNPSGFQSGNLRNSTRSSTRRYFTRVASRVEGVRRSWSGDKLQRLRLRLPKAMRAQPQHAVAQRRPAHAPDEIALLAPKMQRASAMLGRQRVLRLAHVEEHLAVFEHHRLWMLGEKSFQRGGDLLYRLLRLCGGAAVRAALMPSSTSLPSHADA